MGTTRHIRSEAASAARAPGRCPHTPTCPSATEPTRLAAVIVGADSERNWWLLCNGVTVFDSSGLLFTLSSSDLDHRSAA
jgi:Family of unknown function (DUF5999)